MIYNNLKLAKHSDTHTHRHTQEHTHTHTMYAIRLGSPDLAERYTRIELRGIIIIRLEFFLVEPRVQWAISS